MFHTAAGPDHSNTKPIIGPKHPCGRERGHSTRNDEAATSNHEKASDKPDDPINFCSRTAHCLQKAQIENTSRDRKTVFVREFYKLLTPRRCSLSTLRPRSALPGRSKAAASASEKAGRGAEITQNATAPSVSASSAAIVRLSFMALISNVPDTGIVPHLSAKGT